MKKLLLILLTVGAMMSTKRAKAQDATGNASNNGTPVPVATPQVSPASVGVNAVNAPALTVPTAPPVVTLPAPIVAATPTLSAPGVLPAVPAAPAPPPAPAPGTPPPASSFTTTLNLPVVPILPPIPPIPAMPDIRVPIGSN
ncbi:hypothetical protein WG904_06070 [Pedobacter sp. Du54]|uniref:hypothetical protein n=1 Tax=Pedobacter anseongensis TaxID=3133439 RepID=UPI0030ACAF6B